MLSAYSMMQVAKCTGLEYDIHNIICICCIKPGVLSGQASQQCWLQVPNHRQQRQNAVF